MGTTIQPPIICPSISTWGTAYVHISNNSDGHNRQEETARASSIDAKKVKTQKCWISFSKAQVSPYQHQHGSGRSRWTRCLPTTSTRNISFAPSGLARVVDIHRSKGHCDDDVEFFVTRLSVHDATVRSFLRPYSPGLDRIRVVVVVKKSYAMCMVRSIICCPICCFRMTREMTRYNDWLRQDCW